MTCCDAPSAEIQAMKRLSSYDKTPLSPDSNSAEPFR